MIIKDEEFGEVVVRKNPLSNGVKFTISTSGRLQMSVPKYLVNQLNDLNQKRIQMFII